VSVVEPVDQPTVPSACDTATEITGQLRPPPGMQPNSNTVAQMPIGGRRRWSIFAASRQVVASVSAISDRSGPALWRVLRHAGPVRMPGKGTR